MKAFEESAAAAEQVVVAESDPGETPGPVVPTCECAASPTAPSGAPANGASRGRRARSWRSKASSCACPGGRE
jgi:hypothetical protein